MSNSKPENLIIFFRSTSNILQSFDGTRNAIDINEVRRFSPEIFAREPLKQKSDNVLRQI